MGRGRTGLRNQRPPRSRGADPGPPTLTPEYAGEHSAPAREEGASLDNTENIYPDDMYTGSLDQAIQYYGEAGPSDWSAISTIRQFKDKPNATLTVYRAVPKTASEKKLEEIDKSIRHMTKLAFTQSPPSDAPEYINEIHRKNGYKADTTLGMLYEIREGIAKNQKGYKINPGDWVTTVKSYAVEHGKAHLNNDYKVLKKKVKAKDLFTDGNSIYEWGWQPK